MCRSQDRDWRSEEVLIALSGRRCARHCLVGPSCSRVATRLSSPNFICTLKAEMLRLATCAQSSTAPSTAAPVTPDEAWVVQTQAVNVLRRSFLVLSVQSGFAMHGAV